MIKKLNLYFSIWVLFLVLIVFKFEIIYNGIKLLLFLLWGIITNPSNTFGQLDLLTLDELSSIILLFIIPILIFGINYKYQLFNRKIEISYLLFLFLVFLTLFAPLITDFHPNSQPDIRATRFLKPLSAIFVIHLLPNENESDFQRIKNESVKYSIIPNKIFANKILNEDDNYLYYAQLNKEKRIEKSKTLISDKHSVITKKYFIFGTDELGRDVFARVIYGARITFFIASTTVFLSLSIGLILGFLASYLGGYFDLVLSRFTDIFLTIPSIFFVIMILAFWGNSILAVILVLSLTGWMSLFKVVKGEVASIVQKDFFITSKKIGFPLRILLLKEVLPAIIPQIVIASVFQFSNVILAESSLSYLGLGVGLNSPSWGNMILSGQKYMSSGEWLIIIPAMFLILSILAINDFGEKLKQKMNPWIRND
ncbi:MAG: ABC transporter permease [Bacteroidetes bacterium]|nr:ABC transporter permease [Bacteroidota bacterium]MBU1117128.1 ABC transporter permease [Bacteroidota bacterium]MBU1800329.1 ABC transporter permease [Bacteroidota bacterium]